MEYQKIINLLDNAPSQPSKFKTKSWVETISNTEAVFTDCISQINIVLVYNTKDIDVVIPTYSLIDNSDNYSKTSGSL